jgi:hypothetical protein
MKYHLTQQTLAQMLFFPFQSEQWLTKSLLGLLLVLIGPFTLFIPWIFVAGYCFRLMRRVIVDDGVPVLPEWDAWERLFLDGIRLVGILVIYAIPVLLLFTISFSGLLTFPVLLDFASQTNNPFLGLFPIAGLSLG